jgi:hypothetical protein
MALIQVLVIGAGVTLYEALKAADQLAAQVNNYFVVFLPVTSSWKHCCGAGGQVIVLFQRLFFCWRPFTRMFIFLY